MTEGGSSRGWLSRVQAQVAKLGKKKKEEADQLEAALSARHAAELTALDAGGSAGDDDTPAAAASAKLNALAYPGVLDPAAAAAGLKTTYPGAVMDPLVADGTAGMS